MMDWQTLKQDIDRLYRRSQETEELAKDQLWDVYSEAIYLRECLQEVILEIDQEQLVIAVHQLTQAEQFIYREVYHRAQSLSEEAGNG